MAQGRQNTSPKRRLISKLQLQFSQLLLASSPRINLNYDADNVGEMTAIMALDLNDMPMHSLRSLEQVSNHLCRKFLEPPQVRPNPTPRHTTPPLTPTPLPLAAIPVCPDCGAVMVKTHIELEDGSGWITCWTCECEYKQAEKEGER